MSDIEWPEVRPDAKPILKIAPDGSLDLREHVSVDEASHALWEDIRKRFSLRVNLLEGVVEKARKVADSPSEKNLQELRDALSVINPPA